ncbi:alpha/beta fold hydrolase [Leifsonia lichenia]
MTTPAPTTSPRNRSTTTSSDRDVRRVRHRRHRRRGRRRPRPARRGGPVVVLLHGHPRTGAPWYRVAPVLVERGFTVVVPDPPGYGASTARSRTTRRTPSGRPLTASWRRWMHGATTRSRWSVRTTTSGGGRCWRTTVQGSLWTSITRGRTGAPVAGSSSRCWCAWE